MNETTRPLIYSVSEACRAASISRTKLYAEIARGRLRARKCGRRTLIVAKDLEAWAEALPGSRQGEMM